MKTKEDKVRLIQNKKEIDRERVRSTAPLLLSVCKAVRAALSQKAIFPADITAAKIWLNQAISQAEGK